MNVSVGFYHILGGFTHPNVLPAASDNGLYRRSESELQPACRPVSNRLVWTSSSIDPTAARLDVQIYRRFGDGRDLAQR